MDPERFDQLLRALTGSSTRRGIARALVGLTIGGAWGYLLNIGDVGAKKRKKNRKKKKGQGSTTPPPPPITCARDCAGNVCGDDGCGGSCGTCAGTATCENGQCQCPPANQCGTDCCDGPPSCFEEFCTCIGSSERFCSCPANAILCGNGVGCCLAQDACISPLDCFDSGPICACATQTCSAGNDVCHNEFAFCGSGPIGTCGCFTHASGSPLCAVMPPPDQSHCPEFNECAEDGDCDPGEVCANVGCCNSGVLPFVGRCVVPCPTP